MARVTWRGVTLDERTRDMLVEAEKLCGIKLVPTQGSYSTSVDASAGTHSGGGVVDLSDTGHSAETRRKVVTALRRVGFAAFWRTSPPFSSTHYHAVAIGCPDLSAAASRQVLEWKSGGDGLVGDYLDPHRDLGIAPTTWEAYLRNKGRAPFPLPAGHSFGTPESSTVHDGTSNPDDEYHVKTIQRRLGISRTGRFGTWTRVKVANWQLWKGLAPTGRVGSVTWHRMGL